MLTVFTFKLMQPNMAAQVRHLVRLDGSPTDEAGVTAVAVLAAGEGWCLLADHPHNPGVSVTNGAEAYAQAACRKLGCQSGALEWYQLDSTARFDELPAIASSVRFAPLIEPGHVARTLKAFEARAASLPAGLPAQAASAIRRCFARFAAVPLRYPPALDIPAGDA